MRLIKAFLFGLAGLSILALLFSLVMPSTIRISRVVTIYAPAKEVTKQVTELKNWENWHPVFKNDSATIIYSANGCEIDYNNKKTILKVNSKDSSGIEFLLKTKEENNILNDIRIVPLAEPNALAAEWRAVIKLKWYPWEKIYGIFLDNIAGPGYENALNSLKEFSEKR